MSVALVWIRTFRLYRATLEPISLLTSNILGFCRHNSPVLKRLRVTYELFNKKDGCNTADGGLRENECRVLKSHRFRNVKDAPDVEWGIGTVVERVARLVVGLGNVAVELLMLPVTDLFRFHHPQSLMGKCFFF